MQDFQDMCGLGYHVLTCGAWLNNFQAYWKVSRKEIRLLLCLQLMLLLRHPRPPWSPCSSCPCCNPRPYRLSKDSSLYAAGVVPPSTHQSCSNTKAPTQAPFSHTMLAAYLVRHVFKLFLVVPIDAWSVSVGQSLPRVAVKHTTATWTLTCPEGQSIDYRPPSVAYIFPSDSLHSRPSHPLYLFQLLYFDYFLVALIFLTCFTIWLLVVLG